MKRNFFMEGVVQLWDRLELPFLELFKPVPAAAEDLIQCCWA